MKEIKSNFSFSEEELKQERNRLLLEMNNFNNEERKAKKKKFILIFAIILLIIINIKLFFGTIEIYNIFGYPSNEARFYKLTINDNPISVSYNTSHHIPLIPFLINFESNYLGTSTIEGDEDPYFFDDGSDKYLINIWSYSCYSKNNSNYQVECKNSTQNMTEDNDTKFTNVTITRVTKPYEIIYNDKFISDITKYLKTKGQYCVEITAKHFLTETKVYFYFNKK